MLLFRLVRNAFLAVAIACGLMLIYIWIRSGAFSNGISAVAVMLVRDVGIMIAIMYPANPDQ